MTRLISASTIGTPSEVELALGRFQGSAAITAAMQAAEAALKATRWDNLAYLADFLADVTVEHPPTGGRTDSDDEPQAAENEGDQNEGILAFVVKTAPTPNV